MQRCLRLQKRPKQLKEGSASTGRLIKVMQGASARMQDELEAQVETYPGPTLGVGIFDAMLDMAKVGKIAGDVEEAPKGTKESNGIR